jgi:hypothetical protein
LAHDRPEFADKAECARSTVAEALKVLEWAGVLTWVHRIARIQVRERDLFGRWASRWRVIRTSNAYVFRDPQQQPEVVPASKSETGWEHRFKKFKHLLLHQPTQTTDWRSHYSTLARPLPEDCS